jgi:nucleoid-associated protein YgaU
VGKLETAHFEVGVIEGARVTGTVRISAFATGSITDQDDTTLVDSAAVPNAIVTLTRDDGTVLRRLTDARGRFTFAGLRPGRWTLSMYAGALPGHHRLERDSIRLEVTPGDTLHSALRVIPERRTLHIIASAELTATPASSRAAPRAPTKPRAGRERRPRSAARRRAAPVSRPALELPALWHSYTVTRWDISLMQIARYMYGDASLWPKIWVANRFQLSDPDDIHPGQTLRVPQKAPLTRAEREALAAYRKHRRTAAPRGVGIEWRRPVARHSYTVTRWDVGLMQIARYVYGDASLWPKIWVANQFQLPDPDTIRPGQTLLIPDEAPLTPAEIAARDAYLRRR